MVGWPLCEARLVQYQAVTSAVAALSVGTSAVPEGKVWFVIGCSYLPSANETRSVSFTKGSVRFSTSFGLVNPISMTLNPARATFIEQGMEQMLLPGEYVIAVRDAATAGSTMTLAIEYIEIDLPLYTYEEPQVIKRSHNALSTIRQQLGGGVGVSRPVADTSRSGAGEGGGRGLPK